MAPNGFSQLPNTEQRKMLEAWRKEESHSGYVTRVIGTLRVLHEAKAWAEKIDKICEGMRAVISLRTDDTVSATLGDFAKVFDALLAVLPDVSLGLFQTYVDALKSVSEQLEFIEHQRAKRAQDWIGFAIGTNSLNDLFEHAPMNESDWNTVGGKPLVRYMLAAARAKDVSDMTAVPQEVATWVKKNHKALRKTTALLWDIDYQLIDEGIIIDTPIMDEIESWFYWHLDVPWGFAMPDVDFPPAKLKEVPLYNAARIRAAWSRY
jgi:hypothetical protein